VISGTPTTLQPPTPYSIIATYNPYNDVATFYIAVLPPTPTSITIGNAPTAVNGIIDYPLTATNNLITTDNNGDTVYAIYSIEPTLPSGLTFSSSGSISGTPSIGLKTTQYVVTANYKNLIATVNFTIGIGTSINIINPINSLTLQYNVNMSSTDQLITNDDNGTSVNASYAIAPNITTEFGLSFNTTTGVISGTPTTSGVQTFTITANYDNLSDSISINIDVFEYITVTNYPTDMFVPRGSYIETQPLITKTNNNTIIYPTYVCSEFVGNYYFNTVTGVLSGYAPGDFWAEDFTFTAIYLQATFACPTFTIQVNF
jgi:hypothetical protein